jgi:hypothetical protein
MCHINEDILIIEETVWEGQLVIWEVSILSVQVFYKAKTAAKERSLLKN